MAVLETTKGKVQVGHCIWISGWIKQGLYKTCNLDSLAVVVCQQPFTLGKHPSQAPSHLYVWFFSLFTTEEFSRMVFSPGWAVGQSLLNFRLQKVTTRKWIPLCFKLVKFHGLGKKCTHSHPNTNFFSQALFLGLHSLWLVWHRWDPRLPLNSWVHHWRGVPDFLILPP